MNVLKTIGLNTLEGSILGSDLDTGMSEANDP